jgi:hypothetical protein
MMPIDQDTADRLWQIAIGAFAVALIVVVVSLFVGFFTAGTSAPETQGAPVVDSDTILAIFTAFLGFLTGILVPSPVEDRSARISRSRTSATVTLATPTSDGSEARSLPGPSLKVAQRLWYGVIGLFSVGLVAVVGILVAGFFIAGSNDSVETGTLVVILTGVITFLTGVFVPSPVESR